MKENITPLSFIGIDSIPEARFRMMLPEPTHEEMAGAMYYEETIVWPPKDPKDVDAGGAILKRRVWVS